MGNSKEDLEEKEASLPTSLPRLGVQIWTWAESDAAIRIKNIKFRDESDAGSHGMVGFYYYKC